jgi:hypothetical protein
VARAAKNRAGGALAFVPTNAERLRPRLTFMTIVCRSKKFIFVHLHKCGGTSVEQAFAPHARWNDLIVGSTFWGELLQPLYKRRYGLTKHSRAGTIRQAVGPELWSQCWTTALVRHPLRIYESFYGWMSEMADGYMARKGLDRGEFARLCAGNSRFPAFARWPIAQIYAESKDFPEFVEALLARRWMAESMTDRLSQGGSIIVDDVYKLEEIERFWQAFEERTGLRLARLHANRSKATHYQWDPRHVAEIQRRFRDDFVNFRYE